MNFIFQFLQTFFPLLEHEKENVITESFVARLHSQYSFNLLMFVAFVAGSIQLVGHPITCLPSRDTDSDLLERYCLANNAFTTGENDKDEYQYSYLYIYWTFIIQAMLFRTIGNLRKYRENSRLANFLYKLDCQKASAEDPNPVSRFVSLFMALKNSRRLKNYFFSYFFYELLLLLHTFGEIYFVGRFIRIDCLTFGYESIRWILSRTSTDRGPMDVIFPYNVNCTFSSVGPSGEDNLSPTVCFFHQNLFNRWFFFSLSFWLYFLAVLSVGSVCYFFLYGSNFFWRREQLRRVAKVNWKDDPEEMKKVHSISKYCSTDELFFLDLILVNLEARCQDIELDTLLSGLAEKLMKPDIRTLPDIESLSLGEKGHIV